MRQTTWTAIALLVVTVFAEAITGCAGERDETDIRFVIGVAQANLSEPWREVANEEIAEAAESYPGVRIVFTNAGDSAAEQEADIERLIELGIDLLIVSPVESREMAPAIRRAYEIMPVVVLDKAVEGYDYSLFIGVDNQLVGRQAARFVESYVDGGTGTVVEVTGGAGSLPVLERSRGFHDELRGTESVEFVGGFSADWLRDRAEDRAAEKIDLFTPNTVVFAHNDAMALGVRRALSAGGIEDVAIIGIDGLEGPEGGIALVRSGLLAATITCPTGGREAVRRALDILEGRDGLPKKIFLRSSLITRETLAEEPPRLSRDDRDPDDPIVLGFAQVGKESAWRVANTESIISAAEDAGITLLFEDAQLDQRKQIAAIRSFIEAEVDVIAFSPIVETGWDEVLREAKAAGIPVIASDRTVDVEDETLVTTYLVADFLEEGRRAAQWVLDETRGRADVRIVEIEGLLGSTPANDRRDGFRAEIERSPNHTVIDNAPADFIENLGYEVMTRFLVRHERIDVVYAHNDDMALGAIRAIEEAGLDPGNDILLVSIDGVRPAFEAMIEGTLNCTVECSPLLGPQLMKAVIDYVAGEDLPLRINTEEGVFPQEVAQSLIDSRPY